MRQHEPRKDSQSKSTSTSRRTGRFAKFGIILSLVCTIVAVFGLSSDLRKWFWLTLYKQPNLSFELRQNACRHLAQYPSNDTIMAMILQINTCQSLNFKLLTNQTLYSLSQMAGTEFLKLGSEREALGKANQWAAAKLGLRVDDNGGVLTWFAVDERLLPLLKEIGDKDPQVGWSAWSSFGAGTIRSGAEFLQMAGASLADSRPVAFTIKRGAFYDISNENIEFEAQPEPIEKYKEAALVHTVGEAMALKYWCYLDSPETQRLPDDFRRWCTEYAQTHYLPPIPSGQYTPPKK